ncbi:MAG: hypothetical protein ACRD0Q_01465 [Acidimicrobiales bacterium]
MVNPQWAQPEPPRQRDPTALAIVALVFAVLSLLLHLVAFTTRSWRTSSSSTGVTAGATPVSPSPTAQAAAKPGAPSFKLQPLPPANARHGPIDTLSASGTGDAQTPTFTLATGQVGGGMSNNGAYAVFWLVPAGQPFDGGATPTANCSSPCASGGWAGGGVSPGRYYLVVRADRGWTLTLTETY